MADTIAAIATGTQVSAIGIIRLSGDETFRVIDRLFFPYSGKKMSESADRRLIFGELRDRGGELLDVCLCTISRAPHSYTGENTAELQCHGSDIIDAETVECAKNAAGQLSGAISRKVDGIYSALTDISSHYHAVLDYPDEDIEDFQLESYEGSLTSALTELERLLQSHERGKLMTGGIPAAIAGRPNAGKSSLLNALLGYDRAIVTAIPGTTRDTVEQTVTLGRHLVRLVDTAGIRDTDDEVERLGVERSRAAMSKAELVIAVVDGSGEITDEDREVIAQAEAAPKGIVVLSKRDIAEPDAEITTALPVVSLSSVTGDGMDELERVIAEQFPLPEVPAGEILTNVRQADAVKRAIEYMRSALDAMRAGMTPDIVLTETEGAMSALGELSGRTVREDVTNRIFQRFCVGK